MSENQPEGLLEDSFEQEVAQFPLEWQLPPAAESLVVEAAHAIRREHQHSSQWKRLTCRKVSYIAERGRGMICVLELDGPVEFDWTWEGAVAFRPTTLEDGSRPNRFSNEGAALVEDVSWQGEILEVDERQGCLFICLEDPEKTPGVGPFCVRPFEFLYVLDRVYNHEANTELRTVLPARLAAAQGNIHPLVDRARKVGLPHLRDWWKYAWSVLWGPPGTGKTWTTGQQVAEILADPTERVLVVSTTNRATDAVALALGAAARGRQRQELDDGGLRRIGKGAAHRRYKVENLEVMLQGTESLTLHEIDQLTEHMRELEDRDEKALTRQRIGTLRTQLNDRSYGNFLDPEVRVVVATAFKATSFLTNEMISKCLAEETAPFTTVFIDEAGLVSRVAVAALSLLASRRVVLVGDSKQLSPISRISRVLPIRQQRWLASSGLSHLTEVDNHAPAVKLLTEQRRMHADVCRMVSDYQYAGRLHTAPEVEQRPTRIAPSLAAYSRTIWYVLDEDTQELSAIRAGRGPAGKSWIRAATASILERLFEDAQVRSAQGMFITPFTAQTQAIAKLLAAWSLPNWEASTVHSQQGSEADIVIFDTVNASCYTWPYDEWKRLINVALSRAREAVIVLASRNEMAEPYLKPLARHLKASRLVKSPDGWCWQATSSHLSSSGEEALRVQDTRHEYQSARLEVSMGTQLQQRKSLQPILSVEQQRLATTRLDGKPRLVRGVAGSGKSYVMCNWLARTVKRMQPTEELKIWAVYANRSLHKLLQETLEAAWCGLWQDSLFEIPDFPWQHVSLLHVRDVLSGLLPSAALSIDDFDFDYDRAAEEFLNRHDAAELLPRCSAMFIDEAQDMGPATLKLLLSMVEQSDAQDPSSRAAHIFYDNSQNIYSTKTPNWSELGLDMRGRSYVMRESFRSTIPITELAVNVLYRLTRSLHPQEFEELISMGSISKSDRDGHAWLQVHFSQVDGPKPLLRTFQNSQEELRTLTQHILYLVKQERIAAADMCLIVNGKTTAQWLLTQLGPSLSPAGVELSLQTNRAFERQRNTLVMTTAHSYKGYESEVVILPGVDKFVGGDGRVLAKSLYVAMTRARSLLALYGQCQGPPASRYLMQTLVSCFEQMR